MKKDKESEYLEKGSDYTSTTLVHPLLQKKMHDCDVTDVDDMTESQKKAYDARNLISAETYKKYYKIINDKVRSQVVHKSLFMVSLFGDLPLRSDETFYTTFRSILNIVNAIEDEQKKNQLKLFYSTMQAGMIRECEEQSYGSLRLLFINAIRNYMESFQVGDKKEQLEVSFMFPSTNTKADVYSIILELKSESSTQKVVFYVLKSKYTRFKEVSFAFNLCAIPFETKDSINEYGLPEKFISIGCLGQKPFEYVEQSEAMKTDTTDLSLYRRPPPHMSDYIFIGDITSMLYPINDDRSYKQLHGYEKYQCDVHFRFRPEKSMTRT